MVIVDWLIVAAAALGTGFLVRGIRKAALSDCILGLVIVAGSAAAYFVLFSLTRVSYLGSAVFLPCLLASMLHTPRRFKRMAMSLRIAALLLGGIAAATEYRMVVSGNALLIIEPYRTGGGWAFDDRRLGLIKEPFVNGVPEMIDRLVTGIPGSGKSVRLIFSGLPFPGAQLTLDRRGEEKGGNWYYSAEYGMTGWLCPALFKFFPRAPRHIYVKAEPR